MTIELCKTVIGDLVSIEERVRYIREGLESMVQDQIARGQIMVNPTGLGVRNDSMGSGEFGAARRKDGQPYPHKGLDILCTPGMGVVSPIDGHVVRKGLAYANENFELIVIANEFYVVKMMYVFPDSEIIGREIKCAQTVGSAQDITQRKNYAANGMQPHIHVEVRQNKRLINPSTVIKL